MCCKLDNQVFLISCFDEEACTVKKGIRDQKKEVFESYSVRLSWTAAWNVLKDQPKNSKCKQH